MITTIVINPQRASAARVTVLGLVCLSVKSHLTYGASFRPEKRCHVLSGQRKFCGDLPETIAFKSYAANQYCDLPVVSFFSGKRQRVPNDCLQHSALPKTMPTDAINLCCSEN